MNTINPGLKNWSLAGVIESFCSRIAIFIKLHAILQSHDFGWFTEDLSGFLEELSVDIWCEIEWVVLRYNKWILRSCSVSEKSSEFIVLFNPYVTCFFLETPVSLVIFGNYYAKGGGDWVRVPLLFSIELLIPVIHEKLIYSYCKYYFF